MMWNIEKAEMAFAVACIETSIERVQEMGCDIPTMPKRLKFLILECEKTYETKVLLKAFYDGLLEFYRKGTGGRLAVEEMTKKILIDLEVIFSNVERR